MPDVLDMSRIEAGHMELNPGTLDLFEFLNRVTAVFRDRAEAKALRFDLSMPRKIAPYIVGDEGKPIGNATRSTSALAPTAASAELFMNLPVKLLMGLINFTSNGDKRGLDELILKVRERVDTASGNALQDLADKYDYDALAQLMEIVSVSHKTSKTLN